MTESESELLRPLELLRVRDAELGIAAQKIADAYRATQGGVAVPYEYPESLHLIEFYPSFTYSTPISESPATIVSTRSIGKYIAFMPGNSVLGDGVSKDVVKDSGADFIYGDSFHVDLKDPSRFTHQLRPGWSPERLRGHCYVGDVVLASKKLVRHAGGKKYLATLSSHDRALRLSEIAEHPAHVAVLLYGTAMETRTPKVDVEAVRDHCVRTGIDAQCSLSEDKQSVQVIRRQNSEPSVCVIMPTRGTSATVFGEEKILAAHAIESFRRISTYRNIEFLVVADTATPTDALEEIKRVGGDSLRVIEYDKPFNFAEKINIAAVQTQADYLLFMNDDTQIETTNIVEILLSYFEDESIGLVGPLLTYEDGLIQSAGHLLNPVPYDLYRGLPKKNDAAFGVLSVAREVSCVIAAFSITPRALFMEVGGFCIDFPSDYNDVDYALKLKMLGFKTIFTPHASCIHFESKTRVTDFEPQSIALLGLRWQQIIENDPYGNRYLQKFQPLWKSRHDDPLSVQEAMGGGLEP